MQPNKSVIERAFELARSGHCRTVMEVRLALAKEGYQLDQIEGASLIKQLKSIFAGSAEMRRQSWKDEH